MYIKHVLNKLFKLFETVVELFYLFDHMELQPSYNSKGRPNGLNNAGRPEKREKPYMAKQGYVSMKFENTYLNNQETIHT